MKVLLVVALAALIHGSCGTLLIKGPPEPILETDRVVLECLYSDSDLNTSQVHIEMLYKHSQRWLPFYGRTLCMLERYSNVIRDRITLNYPEIYNGMDFRCVSDAENVTEPDNCSQPLTFRMNYLRRPQLHGMGYSYYMAVPRELRMRAGDDLVLNCSASSSEEPKYYWLKEGSDWILPSETLTLTKMSETDAGQYTCVAEHSIKSLSKNRSVSIVVLPEDAPWYQTSYGRFVLMASAAAAVLLVLVVSMTAFLCRRAKRAGRTKGPIDDHSQKKPIYTASVESLPSACPDKQPLV